MHEMYFFCLEYFLFPFETFNQTTHAENSFVGRQFVSVYVRHFFTSVRSYSSAPQWGGDEEAKKRVHKKGGVCLSVGEAEKDFMLFMSCFCFVVFLVFLNVWAWYESCPGFKGSYSTTVLEPKLFTKWKGGRGSIWLCLIAINCVCDKKCANSYCRLDVSITSRW